MHCFIIGNFLIFSFGQLLLEVKGGSTDYNSYPKCFTDSEIPYQDVYVAEDSYDLR